MIERRDAKPNDVVIGLDLGQARDFTALAVVEVIAVDGADPRRPDPNHYAVRMLDRWQPRRYQDVVGRVAGIAERLAAPVQVDHRLVRPAVTLVLDATGVGGAVADLFAEAELAARLEAVTIHGGDQVARDPGRGWRVPKRDLAGVVAVALQNGRLEVAAGLEHAGTLKAEMQNFRARISANGHDSYGAGDDWRQGNHDDLVLAVALSVWWGERSRGLGFEEVPDELALVLAEMGV
jgi:hypothetical protein